MTVGNEELGMVCTVEGCNNDGAGPPVVFNGVQTWLCTDHRREYDTDPTVWDGELDATRNLVVRLWRKA